MRTVVRAAIIVCALGTGIASATEPPTTSAPGEKSESPTTTPPEQPKTPTSNANPSAASTPTSATDNAHPVKIIADEATAAQIKRLQAAGYKLEVHNGKALLCRKEPQFGSHFESKICGTAEELEQRAIDSQEALRKAQRKGLAAP